MPFDQQPAVCLWPYLPDQEVWETFREGSKETVEYIYRRYITDLITG